jgi:hypothetical protein
VSRLPRASGRAVDVPAHLDFTEPADRPAAEVAAAMRAPAPMRRAGDVHGTIMRDW